MTWDHTHGELFGFPLVFPSLVKSRKSQFSLTFSMCVYYNYAGQMIFHAHVLHNCKPLLYTMYQYTIRMQV